MKGRNGGKTHLPVNAPRGAQRCPNCKVLCGTTEDLRIHLMFCPDPDVRQKVKDQYLPDVS